MQLDVTWFHGASCRWGGS